MSSIVSNVCHSCSDLLPTRVEYSVGSTKKIMDVTDSKNLVATVCKHIFHESCLKDWLKEISKYTAEFKPGDAPCPKCHEVLSEVKAITDVKISEVTKQSQVFPQEPKEEDVLLTPEEISEINSLPMNHSYDVFLNLKPPVEGYFVQD